MVAGDDKELYPYLCEAVQETVGSVNYHAWYPASKKKIAAVNHQISPNSQGIIKNYLEIAKKILSPPGDVCPGPDRIIKA